ncbi:InlB B-repeat-containing protein [Isobaculum melis]|uniref:Listeria/Bacterioides repeat-containing protein n=1 Tax=Isobaculum melis TaxID=142588 RepID=A0A1H9PYQ4_9LACT|nr:InlB B-repeat-containing protein [Isobaculum melis]SER53324.1 Listeria/Bacterioides repeat-containing protein [Isobaculum melis]
MKKNVFLGKLMILLTVALMIFSQVNLTVLADSLHSEGEAPEQLESNDTTEILDESENEAEEDPAVDSAVDLIQPETNNNIQPENNNLGELFENPLLPVKEEPKGPVQRIGEEKETVKVSFTVKYNIHEKDPYTKPEWATKEVYSVEKKPGETIDVAPEIDLTFEDNLLEGYTLREWWDRYPNPSTGEGLISFPYVVGDEDITLQGRINNYYTLWYLGTGDKKYGELLKEDPYPPTKEGYTFIGYSEIYNDDPETAKLWDFAVDRMPAHDLRLHPVFAPIVPEEPEKPEPKEYQVTYNVDGVETKATAVAGEFLTEPPAPTKPGYTFKAWYTEPVGGTNWIFSFGKMPENDMTLYARFEKIKTYYLVTIMDGDTRVYFGLVFEDKLIKEPETPSKPGYTFLGWKPNKPNAPFWNFATDTVSAITTLNAVYQADDQTITFDVNTGDPASQPNDLISPTDSDVDVDAIQVPTKPGYTFTGWFNGTEQVSGSIKMPVGGLTLTAHWTAADQTIAFDVNTGDLASQPKDLVAPTDSDVDVDAIQAPTKPGYAFAGWFNGTEQVSGSIKMPADGLTLAAHWTALDQTITFDINGGDAASKPQDIIAPTDSELDIDAIEVPTREGYTFAGWYDAADNKVTGKMMIPAGGLTLKAVWDEIVVESELTIQANDFEIKLSELKDSQAKGTLEEIVLTRSGAQLWDKVTNQSIDGAIDVNAADLYLVKETGNYLVEISHTIDNGITRAMPKVVTETVQVTVTNDVTEKPITEDPVITEPKAPVETAETPVASKEETKELPSTGEKVSFEFLGGMMLLVVGYFIQMNKKRATKN